MAEFIGGKFIPEHDKSFEGFVFDKHNLKGYFRTRELKFHLSFDWLMLVVERIEDLGFEVIQTNQECTISGESYIVESISSNRFDATYFSVFDFIEWYNENEAS